VDVVPQATLEATDFVSLLVHQSSSLSSKRNHHGLSSIEQGPDDVAFLFLLGHLDTHVG
jgi:hypothetical protein